MRCSGIAMYLLAGWLLGGPVPARPVNLVPDGGFEEGLGEWEARNVSGAFQVSVDRRVRRSGRASAHLVVQGGPGQFRADGLALELPEMPPGGTVHVSAQVRGQEMRNGWLKFSVYDEGGAQLLDHVAVNEANLTGTFDWRELERDFEIPEEAVRAELVLYLYLDGEAWLDEVAVIPLGRSGPRRRERAQPLDRPTRAWLDAHAFPVRHRRLRGSLRDLEPLREILQEVRIVQLGENTHRDGACFEAKVRLIRFLHEEMGFEVLAFESGLFECDRANELLRRGGGSEAMQAAIFGIWRNSTVENLFHYLAEQASGEAPLLLAGFDCRASGQLARELCERLAAFLEPVGGIADEDLEALQALEAAMARMGDAYEPSPRALEAGLAAWERVSQTLDGNREALVAHHGAAETDFFTRVLDNWKRREAFERSKSNESLAPHGSTNLRDRAMAENLLWLAANRHPEKRIITWGATFHLAHGLAGVELDGNPRYYEGCRNMGQLVHEALGEEVFTLGFAAHGGKGGAFGQEFDIPRPRRGSVEDLLHRYGKPMLFMDLRPATGPFRRRLRMAPMSYSRTMEAEWPTVLDGVFYIEEMTPAR